MTRFRALTAAVASCAGLCAIVSALWLAAPSGEVRAQRVIPSVCSPEIGLRTVSSTVNACDIVPVTVTFNAECPVCPGGLNAVFVLLESSMQPGWQGSESEGVLDAVERYAEDHRVSKVNLAVIYYDGQDARVVQQLTDDFDRVRGRLRTGTGYIPRGAVVPAANEAVRQIRMARDESGGSESPCELVVMFAHVKSHDAHAAELRRAGNIIKREVQTFLVGCPIDPGAWYCRVEPEMPRSRAYFAEYPENRLPQVARRDVDNWESDIDLTSMALEQSLGPGLQYVDGSASIAPAEIDMAGAATRLMWSWDVTRASAPPTITYSVKPLAGGSFTLTGSIELVDSSRRSAAALPDESTVLVVQGECEVPTPTSIATPTDLPTATPVPPTSTPLPEPIYIPLILSEACTDRVARSDVALVVDLSTSMDRLTRGGRTKLRATQDAVHTFVDFMDLGTDGVAIDDRVAIVGFNRDAWIETGLTSDAGAVHAAIERLPARQEQFTRLDLAFQRGAEALLDPATRDPSRKAVLVVLTDGLPNQVPYAEDGSMETTVVRAAAAAKDAGLEVYTVGVGEPGDVNDALLQECASDPSGYYRAEDAEDLEAIYESIATTLLCPRGRHKWGEPWP